MRGAFGSHRSHIICAKGVPTTSAPPSNICPLRSTQGRGFAVRPLLPDDSLPDDDDELLPDDDDEGGGGL